jgi:hypothetical protein
MVRLVARSNVVHEEHEEPEVTSTPTWPSEEFSLAPAPTFSPAAQPDASATGTVATPASHEESATHAGSATRTATLDEGAPLEVQGEHESADPSPETGSATPEPVHASIDTAELDAARAQIAALRTQLDHAEEENRAFTQSLRHVAAAAEELLAEARAEATALREALERDTAAARAALEHDMAVAHGELDARRASIIIESQREADRLLAESRATAHELVVVARADAREAVHEERRRAADDLEMLAELRERIAHERHSLAQFHTQLSGRLRYLMHSMLEFAEQNPALELGDPASFAATVLTGPQSGSSIALSSGTDFSDAERAAAVPTSGGTRPEGDMHGDEAHLYRAFDAFFSNDIDEDPSRRWILED